MSRAFPGKRGQNRLKNILLGTALGSVLGLGAGFAADRLVKEGKEEAYQKGKAEGQKELGDYPTSSDGRAPRLLPPRTDARWVPDQIRGSTFIPGHFEHFIVEGSRWETAR